LGKKRKQLEATVLAIQRRWGSKALRRGQEALRPVIEVPYISTSFPGLDKALGIGGIPRGRITEILGASTSGAATLALKVIAKAQVAGDMAVYVDLGAAFDPDYAARCQVKLAQLLLVRPTTGSEALEIVHSLITGRGTGVLVFDAVSDLLAAPHGAKILSTALRQLPAALAQSTCALIFLTPLQSGKTTSTANYPGGFALPHYATIRLQLKKEKWLYKYQE
jgi:recombination protein RecA